jgi:murein DD-endopeptidase MepM/ murein hydrolase activator NlpD
MKKIVIWHTRENKTWFKQIGKGGQSQDVKKVKIALKKGLIRAIAATAAFVIWAVCSFAIFSMYFTGGYEFVAEGKTIGYAVDKQAYEEIANQINQEIVPVFGQQAAVKPEADALPCILTKDSLTNSLQLQNNIARLSNYTKHAYVLFINGEETIGFSSRAELEEALSTYQAQFTAMEGETAFLEEIEILEKYIPLSRIYTKDDALAYFSESDSLHVKTLVTEEYQEDVPYSIETIYDETLYEDISQTDCAGENGQKTVKAVVTRMDGIEIDRQIVSQRMEKEPVTQIERIGTRQRPKGIGTGSFLFPAEGIISSPCGARWGSHHDGIDIANEAGTEIYAADEGTVIFSGVQTGYGNIIILDHQNGYITKYGHCNELLSAVGDKIEKGQLIAKMGSTGKSTGPHVHFEIRKNGEVQNPMDYVSQ